MRVREAAGEEQDEVLDEVLDELAEAVEMYHPSGCQLCLGRVMQQYSTMAAATREVKATAMPVGHVSGCRSGTMGTERVLLNYVGLILVDHEAEGEDDEREGNAANDGTQTQILPLNLSALHVRLHGALCILATASLS